MKRIIKRDIEDELARWISRKEILAVRGTRQCGKTTLLNRIITLLLERGIDENNIHYYTFEDDIDREKFEKSPEKFIHYHIRDNRKKHFFLLDEVQYVKNAGKLLKLIYDKIENIKIIVTGSSTLDMNRLGSFLVGRVFLFELYPFSFNEFLRVKDKRMQKYYSMSKINLETNNIPKSPLFIEKLISFYKEYLTYGGYPAVVMERNILTKKTILKNLFLTYIEKDIVGLYGLKYKGKAMNLIRHLASINGGIINYNDLSALSGLYDKEIKEILHILQDTYIIRIIRPYYKTMSTELRKNPKIYFIDTGLRNFITERFQHGREEWGLLLENGFLNSFHGERMNYWRTTAKAEVDFIINGSIPVEVKATPKITRSFRSFVETYKPKVGFIANEKTLSKAGKIGKTRVFFVPLSLF